MTAKRKKTGFLNMLDSLEGDKVIWIIVFLLMMFSILAISSSTSLLAIQHHSSRLSYAMEQVIISAVGLGIIIVCYQFRKIGLFRFLSQGGFAISFFLLAFLGSHYKGIPFFKPVQINKAWRCIEIFGFQLHVFEFVKVFMVMYIAWAMDALKTKRTPLADSLARLPHLGFMKTEMAKVILYVIGPICITALLIAAGSNSSALFIGAVMFATAYLGGMGWKYIAGLGVAGIAGVCLVFGIYTVSDGKIFHRLGLVENRILLSFTNPLERLRQEKPNSVKFREILDETMQPMSAKVAVSEGGLFGKGPGKSTQRYVVSVMFEDYMYSFIIEEYGIIGGIIVMLIYGSLLARGALLVKHLSNHYAKTMIAGLVLLISGQALMHILINVDLFPLTGQTLPMISHGNSSFLAFSLAFGIILSVSRMASRKIAAEAAAAEPVIVRNDEVRNSLDDLDRMEAEG